MKRLQIISNEGLSSLRPYLGLLVILVCLWGILGSARAGASRLFSNGSKKMRSLALSDRAVHLSILDPEAHFTRGWVLTNKGQSTEAIKEFEQASALRPRDFYLWRQLGEERERSGDTQGAVAAYTESTRLAPFYATPRWYLGNSYLRAGKLTDGFAELRRAYDSDPTLLPAVIDLAWRAYDRDTKAVRDAIKPEDSMSRLVLESFFIEQGKATEAVEVFLSVGKPPEWERRELLLRLLAAKNFREGFQVWARGRGAHLESLITATMIDGGFEGRIALDEPGFGWQFAPNRSNIDALLDNTGAHAGSQSLRVEYRGDSEPSTVVVSELVVIEPKTHYKLRFAARSQDLVTGGPPVVAAIDANDESLLAESAPLLRGTNGWQDYVLEFVSKEKTQAVLIQLKRQSCEVGQCPAFGFVWLDSFFLEKF